jgi:hypothetical protein
MVRWVRGLALVGAGAALCCGAGAGASAQGLVREPDSVYRSFPVAPVYRAFLPPEVDLSIGFPPPGDQGKQGSCAGWSIGYALRSYYEGLREHWDMRLPEHQVSPAAVFDAIALSTQDCSEGARLPDALDLLVRSGAVTVSEMPYDPGGCWRLPPRPDERWRIAGWKRVDVTRMDDVKGQIAVGNPVLVGMDISKSFEKLRGFEIYDDIDSPRSGGHAVVLVGYSEPKQAFKLINSWGRNWGQGGFGWISYRVFVRFVDRAYVISVPGAHGLPLAYKPPAPPAPVAPSPALVAEASLPSLPQSRPEVPPMPEPVVAPRPRPAPPVLPPVPVAFVPPVPSPIPPRPERLEEVVAGLPCARIHVEGAGGRAGGIGRAVSLSGFVGSGAERDRLLALAPRAESASLVVRPWPQCEALLSFSDALARPQGLAVRIAGAPSPVLAGGEKLVVEVTTPDFPSHLYVTYLQAGGDAVHLMQPSGLVNTALPPATKRRLGVPPGPSLRISPPYGEEMIVVIASASPLFPAPRPSTEIERDYLTAFRQAFLDRPVAGAQPRLVAAAVATLTTRAP